ncbi:MAG: nuclear transport factor 2 family protein [Cytophagales bacterium]|nr:MAG: nuclear transport factor 2 family protein [Cytophagales bacterium]
MIQNTISTWHQLFTNRNIAGLDELIADNAVFHSPIVHTPQVGKELTKMYLSAAFYVFYNDSFVYVRQVISGNHAVLEFEVTIDGIKVNGVDMITCDEEGKIIDFKVMVRPLKAVNLIHQKMMEMLQMRK